MTLSSRSCWFALMLVLEGAATECDLNSEPCGPAANSTGVTMLQTQKKTQSVSNRQNEKAAQPRSNGLGYKCEGVTDEIVAEIDEKYGIGGAQCEDGGSPFYMSKFDGHPSKWCACARVGGYWDDHDNWADQCEAFTDHGWGARRRRRSCTDRRRRESSEPCLAPSVEVRVASDHSIRKISDITEGDILTVINFNLSSMAFSGSSAAKVLGWSHKLGHSSKPIGFVEIDVGDSKKLRISKEHYIVSKPSASDSSPSVCLVADVLPGNQLPMWDEDRDAVYWQAVVRVDHVTEDGFYTPLLSTSGQLVTSAGFIVPLVAELKNDLTHSNSSNPTEFITPEEVESVYNAWIVHWAELAFTHPCLETFDSAFNEIEGVKILERFFQNHPHKVGDAIDTSEFLDHLKSNPEDLVGVDMAHHLRAFCAELFADST